jgi:hypothetical protein
VEEKPVQGERRSATAIFEDVADVLGNSPEIVRKHYAKWSPARQARIDDLMEKGPCGHALR